MLVDARRELRPDPGYRLKLRDASPKYSLQTAEMLEKLATLDRAQPRHDVEHRFLVAFRAPAPMARDGESVSFIAHALNEVQGGRVRRQYSGHVRPQQEQAFLSRAPISAFRYADEEAGSHGQARSSAACTASICPRPPSMSKTSGAGISPPFTRV